MMRTHTLFLLITSSLATGCGPEPGSSSPHKVAPARVEKLPGEADLVRVTLSADAERRLGIETAAVEMRAVPRRRTLGGETVLPPGAALTVSAPWAGTVVATAESALPEPGEPVSALQPMLVIQPLLAPEARVGFANAVSAAEAELLRGEARHAAAVVFHRRAELLVESEAGSVRALDEAQAELDQAAAMVGAARLTRDALADALGELESGGAAAITIVAPIAGVIRAIHATPGQRVAAGAALFEVLDAGWLWVRVPVYAGDVDAVSSDRDVEVGDLGGRPAAPTRTAAPVRAPPTADAAAGAVHLYYGIDNSDGRFRPGERVGVAVAYGDDEEHLTLPWSAVLHDVHGGAWVYENTAPLTYVRRRVEVRYVDGDTAVLGRGPEAGAPVVTAGAAELFGTEFGDGK